MHLTVLKNVSCPVSFNTDLVINFEEIKVWIRSGIILLKLFRYSSITLMVYNHDLLIKPLLTFIVLRLLCRGEITCQDNSGRKIIITYSNILNRLYIFIRNYFEIKLCIRLNENAIDELNSCSTLKTSKLVHTNVPIYLRADFWFGVKSGGSVGHIAGVVNNIEKFFNKPILLTTDAIPTVNRSISTELLLPIHKYWDFVELPSIASNHEFVSQAISTLENITPAFIYQRYSLNSYLGVKLSRIYKVPFVLEYNGSEIWIARNWGLPLKYEELSIKIENLNLRIADLIVVVSQPMKDELIARNFSAEKILVNPNGVDPERYSPEIDGNLIRDMYRLENKLVIGFIGTFGHWHGAEILAEAYNILLKRRPDYEGKLHLIMIGDGLTLPKVKDIIDKYELRNYCTFTGIVPQEDGPSYLAACDILVAPHVPNPDGTPFFGSPTKLFEYMAMGKGIVASDLYQIGEVLSHDVTALLVKPGDAQDLSTGLEKMVNDQTLRVRLGAEARKEAIAKYTWNEHTRRIIEKLQERCGG